MFRSCLDLLNEPSDLRWLETLSRLRHARQLDEACCMRCSRGDLCTDLVSFLDSSPALQRMSTWRSKGCAFEGDAGVIAVAKMMYLDANTKPWVEVMFQVRTFWDIVKYDYVGFRFLSQDPWLCKDCEVFPGF
jgi:hypothetical protein